MRLSLYKIRANTYKIYITTIGAQIKYITTKWQEFSSIERDELLVDSHLVFSNLYAPLLHNVRNELHSLVFQQLLRLLLVEVIIIQNLLHQFGINIGALTFDHVEHLTVQQLFLDLILRQVAFIFDVVDYLRSRVEHRRHWNCFLCFLHQLRTTIINSAKIKSNQINSNTRFYIAFIPSQLFNSLHEIQPTQQKSNSHFDFLRIFNIISTKYMN